MKAIKAFHIVPNNCTPHYIYLILLLMCGSLNSINSIYTRAGWRVKRKIKCLTLAVFEW
jgi:hypothetical protein